MKIHQKQTAIVLLLGFVHLFCSQALSQGSSIESRFSKYTRVEVPLTVQDSEYAAIRPGEEPTVTMQMSEEQRSVFFSDMKSLEEKGYIDKSTTPTRPDYVMAKIRSLDTSEDRSGEARYEKLESTSKVDAGWLPFTPSQVSIQYINDGSSKYVMRGTFGIKQVYESTRFGILIVDEMRGAKSSWLYDENTEVNGYPAKLVVFKHMNNTWATKLMTVVDDNVLILESNKRITTGDKVEFLKLAAQIISKWS